jgi:hypothetical protein
MLGWPPAGTRGQWKIGRIGIVPVRAGTCNMPIQTNRQPWDAMSIDKYARLTHVCRSNRNERGTPSSAYCTVIRGSETESERS